MPNLQKTILNNLNFRLLVIHTMWFSFLRDKLFQAKATFWEQNKRGRFLLSYSLT